MLPIRMFMHQRLSLALNFLLIHLYFGSRSCFHAAESEITSINEWSLPLLLVYKMCLNLFVSRPRSSK